MMMFKVYYTDPVDDKSYGWNCTKLNDALSTAELFRTKGMGFVTMVSEDPNHVGKSGVDEIKDGKCPDGVAYDWNKSSRIGATRR
jgi:hypothetical protein